MPFLHIPASLSVCLRILTALFCLKSVWRCFVNSPQTHQWGGESSDTWNMDWRVWIHLDVHTRPHVIWSVRTDVNTKRKQRLRESGSLFIGSESVARNTEMKKWNEEEVHPEHSSALVPTGERKVSSLSVPVGDAASQERVSDTTTAEDARQHRYAHTHTHTHTCTHTHAHTHAHTHRVWKSPAALKWKICCSQWQRVYV